MYKAMELWEDMASPGSCKHIRMAAVQSLRNGQSELTHFLEEMLYK